MKLSNIVLAASLSLGSASAFALTQAIDLSTGSASLGNTPVAGGFLDMFTFTTTSPFSFTAAVTSVVSGTQNINFSYVALSGPAGVFTFTPLLPDPIETQSLNTGVLAAGAYTISVLGNNSPSIASYTGSVAITVVPEPETYALLLAGLLTVAFIARRRFD